MTDTNLWLMWASIVIGIVAFVGGYRAGRMEAESRRARIWALEVAARELLQPRHEWTEQHKGRIKT